MISFNMASSNPAPAASQGSSRTQAPAPASARGAEAQGGLAHAFAQLVAALTTAAEQPAQQATAETEQAPEHTASEQTATEQASTSEALPAVSTELPPEAAVAANQTSAAQQSAANNGQVPAAPTTVLPQAAYVTDGAKPASEGQIRANQLAHNHLSQHSHLSQTPAAVQLQNAVKLDTAEAAANANVRQTVSGALPVQLLTVRQEPTGELLAGALIQRSATPANPTASGNELRLDVMQQLMRPGQAEWAPVKVDTQNGQWSRDLAAALGERLTMQLNQNIKEATVRLDPPDLGRIELVVRMDGDKLNVQLNASNAGVRDMLTQHAERLRNDLLQQNLQTVDVQVGQQSQRDSSGRYQAEAEIIAGNLIGEPELETVADDNSDRWLSTSA